MKKRILSAMSMVLAAITLAAVLSACSGNSKISDGTYYLADGQLEITENTAAYTASITFSGKEVTVYTVFPAFSSDKLNTANYTFKGGILTYEDEKIGEVKVNLTVVDKNTIKYGVIKYVKEQ